MPARITPAPGQTIKETTLTEVLPANTPESGARKEHPEFWSWMESIDDNFCSQHRVKTNLYRLIDPEGSPRKPNLEAIDVFECPMTQAFIIRTFGGGHYRLMTNVDGQLRYDELFRVAGKPKDVAEVRPATTAAGVQPNSELGLLLQQMQKQNEMFERFLMRSDTRPIVDEGLRGALNLQAEVFRGGVDAVRSTLAPTGGAAPPNPMDDLMKQFMAAAIAKMMNPADPIEAFAKMATALKEVMPQASGNTSWGVEAIRAIGPALAPIAQAITAGYAASQLPPRPVHPNGGRTIDVQPQPIRANADDTRSNVTPMPGPVNPALPVVAGVEKPSDAAPAPAAAPPPQGGDMMAPNLEWLEAKVVDLINNPELTPEQAASDAATFLQTAAPHVLAQLTNEAALRWVFANRTILQKVNDPARRERFIVAFVALFAEPAPAAAAQPDSGLLLTPEPPPAS